MRSKRELKDEADASREQEPDQGAETGTDTETGPHHP